MSAIPTVKIRAGDSYGVINLEDFRPDEHKVFVEAEATVVNGVTVAHHPVEVEAVYEPVTQIVEAVTIPESALRVTVDGVPVELTFDPPSVETIPEPSEDPADKVSLLVQSEPPAALAPEPSKQYRPGQFTPKRGPGRPRKA